MRRLERGTPALSCTKLPHFSGDRCPRSVLYRAPTYPMSLVVARFTHADYSTAWLLNILDQHLGSTTWLTYRWKRKTTFTHSLTLTHLCPGARMTQVWLTCTGCAGRSKRGCRSGLCESKLGSPSLGARVNVVLVQHLGSTVWLTFTRRWKHAGLPKWPRPPRRALR